MILNNLYIQCFALFVLMSSFIVFVDDVSSFIVYAIAGTSIALLARIKIGVTLVGLLLFAVFAIFAQLGEAEWFYHDMPAALNFHYLAISMTRALVSLLPVWFAAAVRKLVYHQKAKRISKHTA